MDQLYFLFLFGVFLRPFLGYRCVKQSIYLYLRLSGYLNQLSCMVIINRFDVLRARLWVYERAITYDASRLTTPPLPSPRGQKESSFADRVNCTYSSNDGQKCPTELMIL